MVSNASLLGFAFAAADLLVEVEDSGRIRFAAGWAPGAENGSASVLTGRDIWACLSDATGPGARAMLAGLKPGKRAKPERVSFSTDGRTWRHATLSAFIVPELAPRISCALSFDAVVEAPLAETTKVDAEGFAERARETLQQAKRDGTPVSLALVEYSGLSKAAKALPAEAANRLLETVHEALDAAATKTSSACRVGEDRFALLCESPEELDALNATVARAAEAADVDIKATATLSEVPTDVDPMISLRAIRAVVNGFIKQGSRGAGLQKDLSETLKTMMAEADSFRAMVQEQKFALYFQPIVDLSTGATHHYEVLSRFRREESPADMIKMAEELELVVGLDLAVAEKAFKRLQSGAPISLAINISAVSLRTDIYVERLLAMTAAAPKLRKQMVLEVTESAALDSLEEADRRIQALRQAGFAVCIDDFGSGSAAFDYLRHLSVDAVKIDGSHIRDIVKDKRARTMVAHLVELCGSMKLQTVAEFVESEEQHDLLREMGVDFGQGWFYGKPNPQPVIRQPAEPVRRVAGMRH